MMLHQVRRWWFVKTYLANFLVPVPNRLLEQIDHRLARIGRLFANAHNLVVEFMGSSITSRIELFAPGS